MLRGYRLLTIAFLEKKIKRAGCGLQPEIMSVVRENGRQDLSQTEKHTPI